MSNDQSATPATNRKQAIPHAAATLLSLLCAFLLSGCGQFFPQQTSTGTTGSGSGSNSGDNFYVANINGNLDTITGLSFSGTALSTLTGSPYQADIIPTSMVLSPNNEFLYVASVEGGIFLYTVSSTGQLTLGNNSSSVASDTAPSAMAIDSTGNWLLAVEDSDSGNPLLTVYQINTSTGTLTTAGNSLTLDVGTAGPMYFVPGTDLVYATLGTGGVDALTLNATSGALSKLNILLEPKINLASDQYISSDPKGQYLYVSETNTNGVRAFTINSTTGGLTEISGSPFAAGLGIGDLIVDSTGSYLYTVNTNANSISAYSIGTTGALTQLSGSPYTTGIEPVSLVEDSSDGYIGVANEGGTPDFQVFSIGTGGALTSVTSAATGTNSSGTTYTPADAYVVVATH